MFAIIALITSCRSQQCTVHNAQCTVIRDSVSVTYHPGTVLSLTDSTDSADCAPTYGGAIKKEQIPQKVRIDTLIVERWHTQEVPSPPKPIPRFYKDCTKGFWILLILFLGSFAFRILKAIYLKR